MDLIKRIQDYYNWTLTLTDPRSKGWLLVDSPWPTFCGIVIYLTSVYFGPKIMRNRKPFKLNNLLVVYNLAMAALNFYIFWQLLTASLRLNYSIFCEPCRQVWTPDEMQIVDAVWWYYFSKLLEFSDTLFFILRKKDNQLSFLHIYHHSTMFAFWWIGIKWVPSGSTAFPAIVNSFIHVLMYTYYGLAAIGPQMNKYLWWKKYLTIIQLIQFAGALILGFNGLRIDCEFPLWMQYTLCGYMVSFLVLFGRFYVNAYIDDHKKRQKEKQKEQLLSNNNEETIKDKNVIVNGKKYE
ncbi:very long chain fatty acid elongase 4-like [Chironomus tepperi]|uniref:very long chain fatty acid elongase 4-like n=1 Tax=Chironomus tepperi TaxID=113505 RepID=UPI00391F1BB8